MSSSQLQSRILASTHGIYLRAGPGFYRQFRRVYTQPSATRQVKAHFKTPISYQLHESVYFEPLREDAVSLLSVDFRCGFARMAEGAALRRFVSTAWASGCDRQGAAMATTAVTRRPYLAGSRFTWVVGPSADTVFIIGAPVFSLLFFWPIFEKFGIGLEVKTMMVNSAASCAQADFL